jgi:DNA modification methylase
MNLTCSIYPSVRIIEGDALTELRKLPSASVHCCVTSPPYWGLRDYSVEGQLGLEKTPEQWVAKMVEVFREVRRVLRDDGTCWMNLGDSYWNGGAEKRDGGYGFVDGGRPKLDAAKGTLLQLKSETSLGLKPKDLCGIPWRLAFALQADGWWLRSDIIWAKKNCMPESVTDRPSKAHEYIFLLTKNQTYFYDSEAVKEPVSGTAHKRQALDGSPPSLAFKMQPSGMRNRNNPSFQSYMKDLDPELGRNKRSVWTIATQAFPEAHFATFPEELPKICILAGTSAKGCCAKCGAPWNRIIKCSDGYEAIKQSRRRTKGYESRGLEAGNRFGSETGRLTKSTETLGWQPTCRCEAETVPCTVLDPFAGSGTTGQVALELGRSAILIELNPNYAELIKERCSVTPGLMLA